ncbi:MAG: rhomboid family intramembrane serine protease [Hyphomicrobiaceae bacterium]|nr:rhomboid family intramembrane serine protease [Hyphomicrobiaceae bacterium]
MRQSEPIFNVPGSVTALIGVCVLIHIVRAFLPMDLADWATVALAFVPARYAGHAAEIAGGEVAAVTSFVTHMLVHGDVTHLMFNAMWFLAFGGAIAFRIGSPRFIAFTVFTGVAGALTFLAFHIGEPIPVVGASGAVSGMMGAVMRFIFVAMDRHDMPALREAPRRIPLMSLRQTLSDKRIIAITAIWLLINLVSAVGMPGVSVGAGVAWEAHLGGFAAGLLFFGFFDHGKPPSTSRLRVVH